jgi:hypothetical protein
MNIEKSAAIIAKAYLRQVNSKTYDLRSFEYTNKNTVILKIQSLINVLDKDKINETELLHLSNLKDIKTVEEAIEFTKELLC